MLRKWKANLNDSIQMIYCTANKNASIEPCFYILDRYLKDQDHNQRSDGSANFFQSSP